MNIFKCIENIYGRETKMAVMIKDKPATFVIRKDNAKKYIENTNRNAITEKFLKECKKSASLFKFND